MRIARLFCSDIDGTLLGNPESTHRFREVWEALPPSRRPLLCYSSGRLIDDTLALLEETDLPRPEYLIAGVGTQVYDMRKGRELVEYNQRFDGGWDLPTIEGVLERHPDVERQPPQYHHPFKSSWYLRNANPGTLEDIHRRLAEAGIEANVIYSSSRDLDVLPARANKGEALLWLCDRLDLAPAEVIVAGDSGNDASMFRVEGVRGIAVANAQPELLEAVVGLPVYAARGVMAEGVLEGLEFFGVVPPLPPGSAEHATRVVDPSLRALFDPSLLRPLEPEQRELIREGYEAAIEAIHRNITPLGFSACSLDDNDVTGTDENYRSVWGRDGAITLIGTVDLPDERIRRACRDTLVTLFENISPNGQLPANVRIDSGRPDYSGVGGISAIDSGLWAMIAFYNYVRTTGDTELLDRYADQLHAMMVWLGAHDSNNDGLLEIPEAGDWTDLFGRSYNVLYDEVLWFRANVCYGLLLRMRGELERAVEYLRAAQRVRGRILETFWPSTRRESSAPITFADIQFSIGDASFLLAEVTPFSFSWRCDVIGNVLAFLNNVLDVEHARIALRFMWGVGVNEPWPVVNLYPTVQPGAPDWRPYYTVNMLNLPHHYHNGGVWPFIGGMWVRFLNRLGLHDVARHELWRLAQMNRLGKGGTWEFNEWAHGLTGRPMGKRYQAWSASSFIHACRELEVVG